MSNRKTSSRKPAAFRKKNTSAGAKSPKRKPAKQAGAAKKIPRPLNFREAWAKIWEQLFTTPIHLDSALSKASPSQKTALAELLPLVLQRPRSLAHYLRFQLQEEEPWGLGGEDLAAWPTALAMADRLFYLWRKDPHFHEEGRPQIQDYPPWITEEWKRDFGDQVRRQLVETLGKPAPLSLRASRQRGRDAVLSAINDSRALPLRGKSSPHAPFGFSFSGYVPVLSLPLFREGAYEIQDIGSQIMALFALWPETFLPLLRKIPGTCREWPQGKEVLENKKALTVIDACAGAGGKALAMADALGGKGQIFAYDVSDRKLLALRQRAKRLGLFNLKTAKVEEGEEGKLVGRFANSADVVLVDSPCSGWGVLRRNPDLKWRQNRADLERLEELQARLLNAYAPLVKPGGTLTYGVCTFRKNETTEQVERFLHEHPEFTSIGGGYYGPGPSDGFFFHAFRRKAEKEQE